MSEAASEAHGLPGHGQFCWTEIVTNELERCRDFYTAVFGWEFRQSTTTGEDFAYLEFNPPGGEPMGALFRMTSEMCDGGEIPPPHFMNYVHVDDVDAVAGQASGLGGKLLVPPSDIPNVGRFAMIQDPTGAAFAVIRLKGGE